MDQPTLARRWKTAVLLGVGSAMFFGQLRHPIVRFEWPIANDVAGFAMALFLPWLTAVAVFRLGRRWSKLIALIALVPLLLYSAAVLDRLAMTWVVYDGGRDLPFVRYAETEWKGSKVRVYQANGFFSTDFGVVIRQERNLLPGVLLVRQLGDSYGCYSLDVESTDVGVTARDENLECEGFQGQGREYRLRPFLYF
jgi:hypothetical protein